MPLLGQQLVLKPAEVRAVIECPANPPHDATTEKPSTNPLKPDSELGDLNSLFDSAQCRIATDEEVGIFYSRVVVMDGVKQHVMFCGGAEFYSMDRLRDRKHAFENGTDLPRAQSEPFITLTYPLGVDYFSDDLTVLRSANPDFQDCFANVPLDIPALLLFVLQFGECNEKRDGSFAASSGQRRRIIMGCCGQAYTSESVEGHVVPKATYGLDVFDKITDEKQRNTLKATVASCLDAMQRAADYIEMRLHKPPPYNDAQRYERFAKPFSTGLGAQEARFEDLTIQVKHVSEHERTAVHTDDRNCTRVGYTKTNALCFAIKDAIGTMWSIKLIVNSRATAGQWEGSVYGLTPIMTRIHRQMEHLDHHLERVMDAQRSAGGHQYPENVTARLIHKLVLEDKSPWEEYSLGGIGEAITGKRMRLPAAPVRDIFLSAPATIAYLCHQQVADERRTIELVIMAAYHNGFDRFFYLGKKHLQELCDPNSRPSLVYYRHAMKEFGNAFGSTQVGRISPSGVNFKKVYLNERGELNGSMDKVVDRFQVMLQALDDIKGTPDFHHVKIESIVRDCISGWHSEGLNKLDLGEFRLMMAVQICCLIKVGGPGHADLHNLVYPVSALGAARQLAHVDPPNRPYVLRLIMKEAHVTRLGTNAGEEMLCETSEERVGKIDDIVYPEEILFCHGPDGKNLLKEYGSDSWMDF